jgi:hypothetical protein
MTLWQDDGRFWQVARKRRSWHWRLKNRLLGSIKVKFGGAVAANRLIAQRA